MTEDELNDLSQLRDWQKAGMLRPTREAKHVSLSETADAAGVAKSTLSRWETGGRVPHGPGALRYVKVLRRFMGAAK